MTGKFKNDRRVCMSNKQFLWSSFAFIVVDIFFRYFNNDMIFNWQRIIIDYCIFCIIYFLVKTFLKYAKK